MNINQTKLPNTIVKYKNIILIVAIVLIVFAVLYYVFVLNDKGGNEKPVSNIKTLPNIEQEKKLLKSDKFNRLESFLKVPVKIETSDKGRQNPFIIPQ